MFSPHDSPAVNDWFRRLDAAWHRMPIEERTAQREEIQQHLEGLVASNIALGQSPEASWKAALIRFGDPAQIGRKMFQEWQQSQTGFLADRKAIDIAFALLTVQILLFTLPFTLWDTWLLDHGKQPPMILPSIGMIMPPLTRLSVAYYLSVGLGWPLLVGVIVGRKFPLQAIKAAFYSTFASVLSWGLYFGYPIITSIHLGFSQAYSVEIVRFFLMFPVWALGYPIVVYLASVTKRGWYKPTLADFEWPRKQRKLNG